MGKTKQQVFGVDQNMLLENMVVDFNNKFLGIDFGYVSVTRLEIKNAKSEIIDFIKKYCDLFYYAGEINFIGLDMYDIYKEDLPSELQRVSYDNNIIINTK